MEKILQTASTYVSAKLRDTRLHLGLQTDNQTTRLPSPELLTFLVVWSLEWLIVIEYMLEEYTHTCFILAARVPTLMLICMLYWFWLWAMTVWRRTQFGKFTRGERKLWAKAITAFWVAELVTAASFILIFGWLSWGPTPLVPRIFNVSRKGVIIEVVIFSYILMIAYIAKLTLKWNTWHSQVVLSSTILVILSYLLWKDVMLLLTRENLYDQTAARWRNLRTNVIVYSLSHEWWSIHATTRRAPHARYDTLISYLQTKTKPDFARLPQYSEYELANLVDNITPPRRLQALCPLLHNLVDYQATTVSQRHAQPFLAYPRRTGFVPKRITMWQFLVILKMWHHLILVLWWSLYIYRLVLRRKSAYTFLSSCAFNVWCCLILAVLIYSLSFFQRYELFLKFKPTAFNVHRWLLCLHKGLEYVEDCLFTWNFDSATLTK